MPALLEAIAYDPDVRKNLVTLRKERAKWEQEMKDHPVSKAQRDKENKDYAQKMINPKSVAPAGKKPSVVIILGKPGSGKSQIREKLGLDESHTIVDADKAMELMPGYTPNLAPLYHQQAGEVAEGHLIPMCFKQRMNMVMDMTGKNVEKMEMLAKGAKAAGYTIEVHHAKVSDLLSGKRAYSRFKKGKRFVPVDYAVSLGNRPQKSYDMLISKYADKGEEHDTSGA